MWVHEEVIWGGPVMLRYVAKRVVYMFITPCS